MTLQHDGSAEREYPTDSLLQAILSIGSELDLSAVLHRIVTAAASLVSARYGALGVLTPDGTLGQLITVGMTDEQIRAIGPLPTGHGVVGVLIEDPRPLRIREIAAHAASVGFPPNHPPMHTFLGVPVRVREQVFGNLYLTEKEHGYFDEEDERVVVSLAGAAGVAIENARLFEAARQRERWLQAAAEVRTELLSGAATEVALQSIAQKARITAAADAAVLALLEPDGALLVRAADGAPDLVGRRLPVTGRWPAVSDPTAEVDEQEPIRLALAPYGAGPTVLVPLRDSGGGRGVIGVVLSAGPPGQRSAVRVMLETFAFQAAVALQLAAARRDRERLALIGDRDRIARDLHDLVIQRLFASGMQLESASKLLPDGGEAATRIHEVVDGLDATIRDIRSAIYALQTSGTDSGSSVRTRILDLADRSTPALGVAPSVRFIGPVDSLVTPALADHLVAVALEALSNVARHASATEVGVELTVTSEEVLLRVDDNGAGITASGRRSGLVNLNKRAELLGGTLQLDRQPGGGTRLDWRVPLGDAEA